MIGMIYQNNNNSTNVTLPFTCTGKQCEPEPEPDEQHESDEQHVEDTRHRCIEWKKGWETGFRDAYKKGLKTVEEELGDKLGNDYEHENCSQSYKCGKWLDGCKLMFDMLGGGQGGKDGQDEGQRVHESKRNGLLCGERDFVQMMRKLQDVDLNLGSLFNED